MNYTLTVDRFEGDKAVLITDDKQSIVWPKNKLPDNASEGAVLNFSILNNKETAQDKKALAKQILNEIINPDDNQSNAD